MELTYGLSTLLAIAFVAAVAPIVVGLVPGLHLPQVVVFLVGGALIGPEVLDWGDPATVEPFVNLGLGFLFLLAGYELDFRLLLAAPGRLAVIGWAASLALALGVVGVLAATGFVRAFVPVSLALTTTALGIVLPILRENAMLTGAFGTNVVAAGAVGELAPIVAIAIFLSANGQFIGLASLVAVALVALLLSYAPRLLRGRRVRSIMLAGEHSTTQTTLRWTILLLLFLLVIAADFGLDIVLGAFLAGGVLRRWAPGDTEQLEVKLDAIGYGFFIPIFFVAAGMSLDLRSIADAPARVLVFFVLLLVVRGLPALVVYRRSLVRRERVEMTLLTATALPLLVALTHIGLANGTMLRENAAALVGAGVLSVIVFPAAGLAVRRRGEPASAAPAASPPSDPSTIGEAP
ncbi:cation:proton antiporter [Pengzhenrongella frigida]|uniref:Cation:proton antiporter n=1 Tax=Pengzhenrongella frigida TaxID=1259133 RepID=A0A4Q5N7B2_9MICO|nr:cation:proton antiporter [Cellulomonas sp. HLT2-17]RYV52351.1 cation:proton antiporter [Cellulomonas sp. HLT2-17]